jgi:uncharacterized protein YjbJ (UPF0337 family)
MDTTKKTPEVRIDNWKEQKGKLKSKYPILTDSDLHFEQGKKDEMFKNVQTKLGITKDELFKIIENNVE